MGFSTHFHGIFMKKRFVVIGLFHTCKNWTWIDGKPFTLTDKWQEREPKPLDISGLIHKNYRFYGSFSGNSRQVSRGWICEEETGTEIFNAVPLAKTEQHKYIFDWR